MLLKSKIGRSDKGAHVFDEAVETFEMAGFTRVALDGIGALGDGESTHAARRALQPMRQQGALPEFGSGKLIANRQGLRDEHGKHFAAERVVAHRLAVKMIEVDRRCLKLFTGLFARSGRPCPFTFVHRPSNPKPF